MNSKRTAVFFANSRLRVVRMGGGGQKKVALEGNKKGLCKRKVFVREKAAFADSKKWFKQAVFWLRKREAFEGKA